jgi:hypothetical protein
MPAVKEPALVAVIGVGGVLVGAVGSGAVQATVARFDRRRSGRDAARVLYLQLHEGESAIHELRPRRDWGELITDWENFGVAWSQYRDQVTHVLNTPEFALVDSAFACMRTLAQACKRDMSKPSPASGQRPHFDPSDEILAICSEVVKRAKRVVLKASFRWWEVRDRRKALAPPDPPVDAS